MVGESECLEAIMRQVGHDAIEAIARIIMARAQADIPIGDPALDPETGKALRASGDTYWIDPDTYEIGFFTDYAVKQHELLGFKHPRGGGPKYLERNVTNIGPELQEELEKRVREYFAAAVRTRRIT